jgi:hypothetical protein
MKDTLIEAERAEDPSAASEELMRRARTKAEDFLVEHYDRLKNENYASGDQEKIWDRVFRDISSLRDSKRRDPLTRSDGVNDLRKSVWDEAKYVRVPRGGQGGGRFTSKGAAHAQGAIAEAGNSVVKPEGVAQDDRPFYEPTRLMGNLGGIVGMQAAWDIADKWLPVKATMPGKVVMAGAKIAASILGSSAGSSLGEAVARAGYMVSGKKAPESYKAPDMGLGEIAGRGLGGMIGQFAGNKIPGAYGTKLLGASLGAIGGEELGSVAYRQISDRYGNDIAERVNRWL